MHAYSPELRGHVILYIRFLNHIAHKIDIDIDIDTMFIYHVQTT